MKKDNYRDYAAEAYRYYALCGRPDSDRLRKMRLNVSEWQRAALGDLEAVYRVMEKLKTDPEGWITMRCLELIYFQQPKASYSKGAVSERVSLTAAELCISESSVYRIMKRLRLHFALERGLRTDDELPRMISGW